MTRSGAILAVLLAACSVAPVQAQSSRDPWNPPVGERGRDPFGNPAPSVPEVPSRDGWGRGPAMRGEFQLLTFKDELFMLDARTGCTWRRSNISGNWFLDFPMNSAQDECQRRLAAARSDAINGGSR